MTKRPPQVQISMECETALDDYGDSFEGAGYTKSEAEADAIYEVMLRVIRDVDSPVSVLDFGCGLGHMKGFLDRSPHFDHVTYSGLDISRRYLEYAKSSYPDTTFYEIDILSDHKSDLPTFDYIVMNGVFNYRGEVEEGEMLEYWERLLVEAYSYCRLGLAFNVMSKLVDWEREDLFYLSFRRMTEVVATQLTRHFQIRHDYGAFEYTTYLYREPEPESPMRGTSPVITRAPDYDER